MGHLSPPTPPTVLSNSNLAGQKNERKLVTLNRPNMTPTRQSNASPQS